MGASPVGVPSGNPGQTANGLAQLREAVKLLEQVLPNLQMGSDPWKAVSSAISQLGRHASPSDEVPGVQQSALRGLQQNASSNAMMQAVLRSQGGGAGGAPSNGPPAGAPSPM